MFESSFSTSHHYRDPCNEVDLDVIFSRGDATWRVPAFWAGGQDWRVRFSPPLPGRYIYRLESTDAANADFNRDVGTAVIEPLQNPPALQGQGPLRVSANGRYFEHADGTPFFWLGDTWWTGLSDRLAWDAFQALAADRKAKGFTLVQLCAGLVPSEEQAPGDPGFCNEGGPVWEPEFARINPTYFDAADRRILHLLHAGLVPALVGGWNDVIGKMGVTKLEQHWRYIIARYGAYPVFWVVGGEVIDPSATESARFPEDQRHRIQRGWTEVARFIKRTDPYRHPMTVHEAVPPAHFPLDDASLVDFDFIQPSHFGWASIALEVAQLNLCYARPAFTRPVVQGEIGYEGLGETHLADFQRTAFWLAMLNGAAGHSYGAIGTFEAYTGDKPLQRMRWSFRTWDEGMHLAGSSHVGLAASFLRRYPWWKFEPHPEWVTPGGTTLLEPADQADRHKLGAWHTPASLMRDDIERHFPGEAWTSRGGTFREPYAAGIPGECRIIYIPAIGFIQRDPPTVLGLEPGVRYRAAFVEPSTLTRFDLGHVENPAPGPLRVREALRAKPLGWREKGAVEWTKEGAVLSGNAQLTADGLHSKDSLLSVSGTGGGIQLCYQGESGSLTAILDAEKRSLVIVEHAKSTGAKELARVAVPILGDKWAMTVAVQANRMIAQAFSGAMVATTPIVDVRPIEFCSIGFIAIADRTTRLWDFELRGLPAKGEDDELDRHLVDAAGIMRGKLEGEDLEIYGSRLPGWSRFGRDKTVLLGAYRPERLPAIGDWLLVLEKA